MSRAARPPARPCGGARRDRREARTGAVEGLNRGPGRRFRRRGQVYISTSSSLVRRAASSSGSAPEPGGHVELGGEAVGPGVAVEVGAQDLLGAAARSGRVVRERDGARVGVAIAGAHALGHARVGERLAQCLDLGGEAKQQLDHRVMAATEAGVLDEVDEAGEGRCGRRRSCDDDAAGPARTSSGRRGCARSGMGVRRRRRGGRAPGCGTMRPCAGRTSPGPVYDAVMFIGAPLLAPGARRARSRARPLADEEIVVWGQRGHGDELLHRQLRDGASRAGGACAAT